MDAASQAGSELAVDARDLEFAFGKRVALAGLGFRATVGRIHGFLGPNGGGKTTLFRILATLLKPQAGTVSILGCDSVSEAPLVRLQLGVVFQTPSLDLELTVRENLLHHGHLYGLHGRQLAKQIDLQLDRFALSGRRSDRVKELSGGLRRRVEIAKALLHRPRVLLLDEPSTGLDPGARRDLWSALEDLRESDRVTVLLTTHYMEEGDRCDRIALVDEGRIVARGRPQDLKDEIGGDVVLLHTQDPERLSRDLDNRFDLESSVHGDVVRFERERAHEIVGVLVDAFANRVEAVTVSKPTLEDVFLHRTGRGLWEGGQ